jgi:hypothetical protein
LIVRVEFRESTAFVAASLGVGVSTTEDGARNTILLDAPMGLPAVGECLTVFVDFAANSELRVTTLNDEHADDP